MPKVNDVPLRGGLLEKFTSHAESLGLSRVAATVFAKRLNVFFKLYGSYTFIESAYSKYCGPEIRRRLAASSVAFGEDEINETVFGFSLLRETLDGICPMMKPEEMVNAFGIRAFEPDQEYFAGRNFGEKGHPYAGTPVPYPRDRGPFEIARALDALHVSDEGVSVLYLRQNSYIKKALKSFLNRNFPKYDYGADMEDTDKYLQLIDLVLFSCRQKDVDCKRAAVFLEYVGKVIE